MLKWDNSLVTSTLGLDPARCGGLLWKVKPAGSSATFATIGGTRCTDPDGTVDPNSICSTGTEHSIYVAPLDSSHNANVLPSQYHLEVSVEYVNNIPCVDTDNGRTDTNGSGCANYLTKDCGLADGGDFISSSQCCICGGGQRNLAANIEFPTACMDSDAS